MLDPRGVRCRAVSASPVALDLAATTTAAPARIHSVFRSAINIETSAGLLTLASAATGGLPNGILLEPDDLRQLELRPGLLVTAVDGDLRIPRTGVVIEIADATRWSPRFPARSEDPGGLIARWRGRSATAWRAARLHVPRGGLHPLFWPEAAENPFRAAVGLTWVPVARTSLDHLAQAITSGDRDAATDAAGPLIGLGDGATPSGDDALMGIEAVLHALGDPLAGFLAGALDDVEERTTVVAAAFLRFAANGEFAARLHDLVAALLDPDEEAIASAIGRAAEWGATSGADGLLGVLRALDAVADRPIARRKTA